MTMVSFLPRPPGGFVPSSGKVVMAVAVMLVAALVLTAVLEPADEGARAETDRAGEEGFLDVLRDRIVEQRAAERGAALSALAAAPVEQTVTTRLRHVTALVVPPPETLAEVVVGDTGQWEVSSSERMVFIRPLAAGAASNLLLLTASGEIVPLLVVEDAEAAIDTVVRVETGTTVRRGVPAVHPVTRIAPAAEAGP